MSVREINISRLRVKASGIGGKQAGEVFGSSIAAKLAETLQGAGAPRAGSSIDTRDVRVRVPRGQIKPEAIARVVREAIDAKTAKLDFKGQER